MYPQVCQRVPVLTPIRPDEGISPIELSRSLNSVACSLSVRREDPIAIYHLVMEVIIHLLELKKKKKNFLRKLYFIHVNLFSKARRYMKCLWNCVQFWLCCMVTLSLVQAISAFLLLPPLFNVGQVLWLTCLIVPLIAVSLVGSPSDSMIMQQATGKNQSGISAQVRY